MPDPQPTSVEVDDYYHGFSLTVGLQDWRVPNGRHERLKAMVAELLEGRRDLTLLDIGCGAGVMAAALTSYGRVTGIDLSEPAIRLARDLVPEATFVAGRIGPGVLEGPFDVVTLFDVLEHVPESDLAALLSDIDARLADGGTVIASTPHPDFIRWLRRERPDLLQVVDELVELRTLLDLTGPLGWELREYRTYDVDRSGQYQLLAFARAVPRGERPQRPPSAARRELLRTNRLVRMLRRVPVAARLGRARGRGWALWVAGVRRRPPR